MIVGILGQKVYNIKLKSHRVQKIRVIVSPLQKMLKFFKYNYRNI